MRLETQELRVFAAVIENSGFKRAAEKLHISQSAVSQAVANLERKLDQRLLQRKPLEATEAGVRILTYAQHAAREEEFLLADLGDMKRWPSRPRGLRRSPFARNRFWPTNRASPIRWIPSRAATTWKH